MVEWLSELLWMPFADYSFMRRALAGCLALSLSAAPVGAFLMLRRMSLAADAMSHAILPGAGLAYVFFGLSLSAMTFGGVLAGLMVVLAAGAVARGANTYADASLAAFYLISLSLGVLLVSLRGNSIDLLHVLFGSVLALDDAALALVGGIAGVTILCLAAGYRALVLDSVDPEFLRGISRAGPWVHHAYMVALVFNLVAAFHALGTLMAIGIMVLPAASVRFWTQHLPRLLALAAATAMVGCVCGLLASYHLGVPAGPAIVLVLGLIYVSSLLAGPYGLLRPHRVGGWHFQS